MNRFSLFTVSALLFIVAGCCEPLPCKSTTPIQPVPVAEAQPAPVVAAPEPALVPLILLKSPTSNTVSFRFVFRSGSADDPANRHGLTALTARLLAEGGTEALSYPELIEKLFPMAASIDVNVEREQTVFYGRVHQDHASQYYSLLKDVLTHPRLDEADFRRVQQQLVSELALALRGNNDEELTKAALSWAMYEGHPYQAPVIGTETDLRAATLDDVKVHLGRVFCGARLSIGLAGAISDELLNQVSEDLKALPQCTAPREEIPTPAQRSGRRVLLVDKPSAESTAISIGFPLAIRRGDVGYAALKLVEAYLGQHRAFIGVLQNSIREERGFNYGDYAYVEHFEQDGWQPVPKTNIARSHQYFSMWLRPVKDADKHFVLRLAIYELERLIREGISQENLEKTRTFMKRNYLTFALTESQQLGYALDTQFYEERESYFKKLFSDLDALNADIVNAAIREYLTKDNLTIAMVTKNAEEFARVIAADQPSPVTYVSQKPADIAAEDKIVQNLALGIPLANIAIIKADDIFK